MDSSDQNKRWRCDWQVLVLYFLSCSRLVTVASLQQQQQVDVSTKVESVNFHLVQHDSLGSFTHVGSVWRILPNTRHVTLYTTIIHFH